MPVCAPTWLAPDDEDAPASAMSTSAAEASAAAGAAAAPAVPVVLAAAACRAKEITEAQARLGMLQLSGRQAAGVTPSHSSPHSSSGATALPAPLPITCGTTYHFSTACKLWLPQQPYHTMPISPRRSCSPAWPALPAPAASPGAPCTPHEGRPAAAAALAHRSHIRPAQGQS